MNTTRRFCEFRHVPDPAGGGPGYIEGTAVRYGDTARVSVFGSMLKEQIRAGAFGDVAGADLLLNIQHERSQPVARTGGGGLELIDGSDALTIRAELPDTTAGRDALVNIERRILRGLSVEFRSLDEDYSAGVRIVKRARLTGVALVDKPAYTDSDVEIAKRYAAAADPERRERGRRIWY